MIFKDIRNGRFYNEDCFDAMKEIPDGVIDMILADLPYGTTAHKWDSILPFKELWAEYWRVLKINGAIVLTAGQPFTSNLIMSQIEKFRYELIYYKSRTSNPSLAKNQPLRHHENILIFGNKLTYNPQMVEGEKYKTRKNDTATFGGNSVGTNNQNREIEERSLRYPRSVLEIKSMRQQDIIHPTQKPVALFEYLIKTYTNENELILDNTAGSGTTAIAAINTNRKWVCIEKEKEYYDKAIERIVNHGWK